MFRSSNGRVSAHRPKAYFIVTLIASAVLLICSGARGIPPDLYAKSTVDEVLDALQASGKNLKTFTAIVKRTDTDLTHGTDTYHNGTVALKIKPNGDAQLHLLLTDRQFGTKKPVAQRREYVLDDGWITDRDFTIHNEVRRQVTKPGHNVDLFQLGKGPFPLPIGQDKKDVHAHFDVALVSAENDDPVGAIHLALTPKPKTEYATEFKVIDVWVDPKLRMPVRIETTDFKGAILQTTDLTGLKINPDLPTGEFQLPPLDAEWRTHDEPIKE